MNFTISNIPEDSAACAAGTKMLAGIEALFGRTLNRPAGAGFDELSAPDDITSTYLPRAPESEILETLENRHVTHGNH